MVPSAANAADATLAVENAGPIGQMALDLIAALEDLPKASNGETVAKLTEMLSFAASAEQTLAEQRARIAQLESLSITDELTGLLNRRGFDAALDQAIARAKRHQETGLVCYVDLNFFKTINDTYGHQAGDLVLQRVARTLTRGTRTTDAVARLGGDEFAVLLVNANPLGGRGRILNLHRALNELDVEVAPDTCVAVTASIGMAAYGPTSCRNAVLQRADEAMYRCKRQSHIGPQSA